MTFEPTPLNIALLVLVAAGIWALVELALTIRKARDVVDDLAHTANDTVGQTWELKNGADNTSGNPSAEPLVVEHAERIRTLTIRPNPYLELVADEALLFNHFKGQVSVQHALDSGLALWAVDFIYYPCGPAVQRCLNNVQCEDSTSAPDADRLGKLAEPALVLNLPTAHGRVVQDLEELRRTVHQVTEEDCIAEAERCLVLGHDRQRRDADHAYATIIAQRAYEHIGYGDGLASRNLRLRLADPLVA